MRVGEIIMIFFIENNNIVKDKDRYTYLFNRFIQTKLTKPQLKKATLDILLYGNYFVVYKNYRFKIISFIEAQRLVNLDILFD